MILLKQSTAATLKLGPYVDSSDGVTPETGLSIAQADIRLSKNGGDFAQTNNAAGATHDENGYYDTPLDTTDTGTLGRLKVAVSKSGALPVWADCLVVPANVYDSIVLGTDDLDVEVASIAANAVTATAIATDAITAAKIAADAIGSSELATTAVSEIVSAVWAQTVPSLFASGTAGHKLGNLAPLDAEGVRAAVGLASANLDTQLGVIVADTNELQTNQGNWLTATGFATSAGLAAVDAKIDTIDGIVDAILADTDELQGNQGDWATATGFATSAGLAAVDAKIDTIDGNVDLVLEDTGTTLPAAIDAAIASVGGVRKLGPFTATGTPTTTTVTCEVSDDPDDANYFPQDAGVTNEAAGMLLIVDSGYRKAQIRGVVAHSVSGTTLSLTFNALKAAMQAGDVFYIGGRG